MYKLTFAALLALIAAISVGHSEAEQEANKIFSDSMVRGAVNLTRLPNVGLQTCGASAEYVMGFSVPTFTEELVLASRGGAKQIVVDNFSGERVENRDDKLDYWLAKIRMSGGSAKLKDVTPNQSVVTAVIDWVLQSYAKELVSFVTSSISKGAQAVYGVAADEYISAGIRRYDAVTEYVRDNADPVGHGVIQKLVLTCVR
jgi:hypothetical protein